MAQISKNVVDAGLRECVFSDLLTVAPDIQHSYDYEKINDRQYGCIIVDANGVERYVRIGVIVAEEREDMTARELMQKEQDEYATKQAIKAQKAQERAKKAEKDKAQREKKGE